MTFLERLEKLLPRPARPLANEGNWAHVERDLGTSLPTDYKQFISAYGTGRIGEEVRLVDPFWNPEGSLLTFRARIQAFRNYIENGYVIPYSLFPAMPGLLPFGVVFDDNLLSWYTAGSPDEWGIVYYSHGTGFFEWKDLTLTQFLLKAISEPTSLPEAAGLRRILSPPLKFQPFRS